MELSHRGISILRSPQIQLQQPPQNLLIAQIRRPAVGGGYRGVQAAVDVVEPGRALVVEIRERPLRELLGALFVFGDEPRVAHGGDAAR